MSIFIGSANECIEETCISFENLLQNTSAYGSVFVQTGLGFEFQQSSYRAEIDIYNIRVIGASINTIVRGTASNIAFIIKNTVFFAGVASYTFSMNLRGKWTNHSHASQHVNKVIHCEFKSSILKPFGSMDISFISETLLGAVQTVNIIVYKCYFSEITEFHHQAWLLVADLKAQSMYLTAR